MNLDLVTIYRPIVSNVSIQCLAVNVGFDYIMGDDVSSDATAGKPKPNQPLFMTKGKNHKRLISIIFIFESELQFRYYKGTS